MWEIKMCIRDSGKAAVLQDAEGHHALVRDGVEGLSVAGGNYIGRVVHLHLTPFLERSFFHVHIKNRDSLCLPGVGVGPYISHIFTCLLYTSINLPVGDKV